MRQINLVLLLILIAASGQSALAADRQGEFAVKGFGFATCKQYTTELDANSKAYFMFGGWIEGYFTAMNQHVADTYDITPWETTELLARLIENHCRRNPEHRFFAVLNSLGLRLKADRLRTKSEAIETEAGEHKAVVYREVMRRVQKTLKQRGFYRSVVDGLYGPNTRTAIEAFQKEQGDLQVTGVPDQVTLLRLLRQLAP